MKRLGLLLALLLQFLSASAQVFDVDTLQYTGDINNRINFVILSDGYQEHELPKFVVDAQNFSKAFFAEPPYAAYQDYFNVFIIKVPSKESGANHPGTATDVTEPAHPTQKVDNYFGSTFDYANIHRLLVPTKAAAITNVLATNFPAYDQVLFLVNSEHYGGSGGQYATASLNSSSTEVAIHEVGHSLVGLKDEYYAGDGYASEGINMTKVTSPADVRWRNWYNYNEVGIYQHCCGSNSSQWYRPHQSCKMRFLNSPFCSVCTEGTIERMHALVSPIDAFTPSGKTTVSDFAPAKFELNLIKSKPNTLKVSWSINGVPFKKNTESVLIDANSLNKGTNTLTALVQDTTQLLRVDKHDTVHSYSVSWTIENTVSGTNADLTALAISDGTLSPAFASGTVNYESSVAYAVSSIKVTPTPQDATASVKVNGTTVASGTASSAIALKTGSNTITVVVTAKDGKASKTYKIEVVREDAPARTTPTITFHDITRTYSLSNFNLAATSNSTGAITYQIVEELTEKYPGDVTLSDHGNSTVTVLKSGKVRLRANLAEDEKYFSGSAEIDLTINKAAATVSITDLNHEFNEDPKPVAVTTAPTGLAVQVLYNGSETVPSAAGQYDVSAVVVEDNYAGEANAMLVISTVTAVEDPELAKFIKLYPNPTAGKAKLELKAGMTADVTVRDLSGRLISQGTATNEYEINLEKYAPGIYLIIVQPEGKNAVTFKLQKQ